MFLYLGFLLWRRNKRWPLFMSRSEVKGGLGWASDSTEPGGGDGEGGGPGGVDESPAAPRPRASRGRPASRARHRGWGGLDLVGRELAGLRRARAGWPPCLLSPLSRRG